MNHRIVHAVRIIAVLGGFLSLTLFVYKCQLFLKLAYEYRRDFGKLNHGESVIHSSLQDAVGSLLPVLTFSILILSCRPFIYESRMTVTEKKHTGIGLTALKWLALCSYYLMLFVLGYSIYHAFGNSLPIAELLSLDNYGLRNGANVIVHEFLIWSLFGIVFVCCLKRQSQSEPVAHR